MNMRLKPFLASLAMAGFGVLTATSALAQQASLTLNNSDAALCFKHLNDWSLTKQVSGLSTTDGKTTVTFTVTANKTPKDGPGSTALSAHGALVIKNTGSAPATIGNIVINLQKPNSPKKGGNASHVSLAADVADATNGDGATSANIVAAASQETASTNAAWGTNNYTTSGARGTFVETSGSGSLVFRDANDNSIFSLVPQPTLAVGATITLLYDATFNVSVPVGTALRIEALVSFGNAGARGGSGATASNIDINGNGVVDADEKNVRTVPSRIVRSMPALEECNDEVTVTDPGVAKTGTLTISNPVGFDAFPATINKTTSWDVSVDVDGGALGGTVTNTAYLDSDDEGGLLIIGYHTDFDSLGQPILVPDYAPYVCCLGIHLIASASEDIGPGSGFHFGDFYTYSKGGYGGAGVPGQIFQNNFISVFNSGLTIGLNSGYNALWNATTTGRNNLAAYLTGAAAGPSGSLGANSVNPTTTAGGQLPRQTAALTLNVGFDYAGVLGGTHAYYFKDLKLANLVAGSQIGGWTLTAAQAAALNGTSVQQVLADANTALAGGGLPSYVGSFGDLNKLVEALNLSFHEGAPSTFAINYLSL